MVYIDSSSLLKLLWAESEGPAVSRAIQVETSVVVSALTELEALVQLKAAHLGGEYGLAQWRRLEARLAAFRNEAPYEFRPVPAAVFRTALRQHRNAGQVHCRTIDRLHLAAMEELGLTRLMTHDARQAKAALAAGFQVLSPGRDHE